MPKIKFNDNKEIVLIIDDKGNTLETIKDTDIIQYSQDLYRNTYFELIQESPNDWVEKINNNVLEIYETLDEIRWDKDWDKFWEWVKEIAIECYIDYLKQECNIG